MWVGGQGKGKMIQDNTVHSSFGKIKIMYFLCLSELSLHIQNNYVYKQYNYFFILGLFLHSAVLFID